MTDEVVTTPETQPVDTSHVSEQAESVAEAQPQEVEITASEPEVEASQEQPQRQTRAEKRLHDLLQKGRQPERDPYQDFLQSMPDVQPSEDGTIGQEELQQLVAKETAKNVALAREMDRYNQQVQAFTGEVEQVGEQLLQDFGQNKALAEKLNTILADMIEKANVRTGQNGEQVVVPSISPMQLYSQLKETLHLAQSAGKEQTTASLAQQLAEGAITPSTRQQEDLNPASLTAADIWKNPSATRQALRAKLSIADE